MSAHPHTISTWQFIKQRLRKKKIDRQDPSSYAPPPAPLGVTIATIAVVLDGQVQEVLQAQDRLAALLLSEPTFVDITDQLEPITIGWAYDGKKFLGPVGDEAQ